MGNVTRVKKTTLKRRRSTRGNLTSILSIWLVFALRVKPLVIEAHAKTRTAIWKPSSRESYYSAGNVSKSSHVYEILMRSITEKAMDGRSHLYSNEIERRPIPIGWNIEWTAQKVSWSIATECRWLSRCLQTSAPTKGSTDLVYEAKHKVQGQWRLYCMVHNIEKIMNYGEIAA